MFLSLLLFPVLDLPLKIQIILQHVLRQRLSAERVIWRGQDVSLNVLPLAPERYSQIMIKLRVKVLAVSPVAAGELDRVLHQLAHNGAAELVGELVPLLLLLHPLYHNLVCSLTKILKPEATCP